MTILSIPFLITLGITLLLIGLLGIFFTQRLQELNHKITSMFGLVSTMAEEMNFMRSKMQAISFRESTCYPQPNVSDIKSFNLIHVSDDEESEIDSSDSESESSDSDSESSDSESESSEELDDIKIINFIKDKDSEDIILTKEQDLEDLEEKDLDLDLEDLEEKDLDLEEKDFDIEDLEETKIEIDNDIKNIFIDSEKDLESSSTIDYKKLSLAALKQLAIEKNLTNDTKLKKNELLKLFNLE